MKKLTAILLSILMLLGIAPLTAYAENGPSEASWGDYYYAFISLYNSEQSLRVFGNNETHNDLIEGATYDRATNTLTLEDFNHPELNLSTNMMGDDFKLVIKGDCELSLIYIWGDGWGGSLDIEGDGTLTVNRDNADGRDVALRMQAESSNAKLHFGEDVTVKLYAAGSLVQINYTAYSDLATGITFGNGADYDFIAERQSFEENVYVPMFEYEDLGSTWTTYIGYKVECAAETDPDVLYSAHYNEEDDTYTLYRYAWLADYDALVRDRDFGQYGSLSMNADELANAGYTLVLENQRVLALYTDEWMEEHNRGLEADRLISASDPDGVYACNYGWITDREHPTDYFIRRLVWDESIEFYVPDESFEDLSLEPDEFAESEFSYATDEDGARETVRYLDEYTGIDNYGDKDPLVLNDAQPGKRFIVHELHDEGSDEVDSYFVYELIYNEQRGYDFRSETGTYLTLEEFEEQGYYFSYEMQPVEYEIEHTGEVNLGGVDLYTDANGKQYGAAPWQDKVYDFSEDNTVELFGNTYYILTENTEVALSDLTPVVETVVTDFYHYEIKGTELLYNEGSAPARKLGDANGDGDVDITDATQVQKHAAGLITLTGADFTAADVNGDGVVDVTDATRIQLFAAGLIDTF